MKLIKTEILPNSFGTKYHRILYTFLRSIKYMVILKNTNENLKFCKLFMHNKNSILNQKLLYILNIYYFS